MDFSTLTPQIKTQDNVVNPIELFSGLPSLGGTLDNLWEGQVSTLKEWDDNREEKDILISLNTGAGKTVIGLLIAQSLFHEGIENVVYICSTNDLVRQTKIEANRIGIKCTTRIEGKFNNQLFQTGMGFCITTYASLFNGHSSITRYHFPKAIIFDDAHVAESSLRGSFTLTIDSNKQDHSKIFEEICNLFAPHFESLGIKEQFQESLNPQNRKTVMVTPREFKNKKEELLNILKKNNIENENDLKFPFQYFKHQSHAYMALFSYGKFELTPPFLPSLALDIFNKSERRVYLSATLQSQAEFIRAFGRKPKKEIKASNDIAGNGERLIIKETDSIFNALNIRKISETNKILIAVPGYMQVEKWHEIAVPSLRNKFSEELNNFRDAKKGGFILVSRVDGIDLPRDTCRIMLIDGLPSGMSCLERYQYEFLHMTKSHDFRIASRLTQLFGRINRGRSDYSIFFIVEGQLSSWLSTPRKLSLLPPLLQKQIALGEDAKINFELQNIQNIQNIITASLNRDDGWLKAYKEYINSTELQQENYSDSELSIMEEATLTEAQYAKYMWQNNYSEARKAIEKNIDNIATVDEQLGGWHGVWLGATFDFEEDPQSAEQAYKQAKSRLGANITLPKISHIASSVSTKLHDNNFAKSLMSYFDYQRGQQQVPRKTLKLIEDLKAVNNEATTPPQFEASVQKLGEFLGFDATRPDKGQRKGPDDLWIDDKKKIMLGFELKTDKVNEHYNKEEIAQGLSHLEWMKRQYSDYKNLGLLYIGLDVECTRNSSPADTMGLCTIEKIREFTCSVLELIERLRAENATSITLAINETSNDNQWQLESIAKKLRVKDMQIKTPL